VTHGWMLGNAPPAVRFCKKLWSINQRVRSLSLCPIVVKQQILVSYGLSSAVIKVTSWKDDPNPSNDCKH